MQIYPVSNNVEIQFGNNVVCIVEFSNDRKKRGRHVTLTMREWQHIVENAPKIRALAE